MPEEQIVVYGTSWCGDCHRTRKFLGEQMVHFHWVDIDKDGAARAYVERVNNGKRSVPTIVFPDGSILVEPSNAKLAEKLRVQAQAQMRFYDAIIIGGGPAGLTAAIYLARDNDDTLVIERSTLGGQASISDEIEHFPGFPGGLSGAEFVKRLIEQARQLGVEILEAQEVAHIEPTDNYRVVHLADGSAYNANAVLLTTGATYRKLNVPGEHAFIGAGVHFCASCDAPFYRDTQELLVIGHGEQAVRESLFLAQFAKHVTILAQSDKLIASQIAQDKLSETKTVEVRLNTRVKELRGNRKLETVVVENTVNGKTEELHPAGVFVFIGTAPNNSLAQDLVTLDQDGFILTGHDLVRWVEQQVSPTTTHVRIPHAMETSVRGIFAAGDVRAGAMNQIASAVGEGASAAIAIQEYLKGR